MLAKNPVDFFFLNDDDTEEKNGILSEANYFSR